MQSLISSDTGASVHGGAFLTFGTGRVTGSTGCTAFEGAAAVGPGKVVLTEPTKRALPCAPQLRESDAEVLELLSGELKVSIAGDRPMLTRADGRGLELRVVS